MGMEELVFLGLDTKASSPKLKQLEMLLLTVYQKLGSFCVPGLAK